MSLRASISKLNFLSRVIQPVFQKQSYLNILYILLAFPIGTVYFICLIIGLSLTVGLLISVLALLITLGMIGIFTKLELKMTVWLLKVDIPQILSSSTTSQNLSERVSTQIHDVNIWKHLAYLLAKIPIGVISFIVVVFLVALTGSFLIAPLTYTEPAIHVYSAWKIDTLPKAFLVSLLGLGSGIISIHIINGLAFMQGQFARHMLGTFKSGMVSNRQQSAG